MARSTSKEIAAYLQWRVREWVRSGKTARELARAAGISTAQVSELQNSGIGAGWKTAESLGRVFQLSMPELMAAAADWSTRHAPLTPAAPDLREERRALASRLAREDGVSDEAIRLVLAEEPTDQDMLRSTVWWILRMRRRDLDLAGSTEPAPSAAKPDAGGRRRARSPT